MQLEIKKYPDRLLEKKAETIREINPGIKELILNMKETMISKNGVGLSAPQVGISKKIIVVNFQDSLRAFINPEIVRKSLEKTREKEGCLSFPGLWLDISRSRVVKVKALDEAGREIMIEAKDSMARIFQHEIDHLKGILFFERLGLFEKLKLKRDLRKPLWT